MEEQNLHIAAFDLGSTEITGIVAEKDSSGKIRIIACDRLPADDSVQHGRVRKSAANAVNNIRQFLENRMKNAGLKQSVERAFVCTNDYDLDAGTRERLAEILRNAKLELAGVVHSPLASAQFCLTQEARANGCALVDFGAESTSVCVFENGSVRHSAVVPFGGRNVTLDIAHLLNINENEAENLKRMYADANSSETQGGDKISVIDRNGTSQIVPTLYLAQIAEARVSEILEMAWEEIRKTGSESRLKSGIYITGQAARLKNLDELLRQKTRLSVTSVAEGVTEIENVPDGQTLKATVGGLLMFASEECLKPADEKPEESHGQKKPEKEKNRKKGGFINNAIKKLDSLFGEEVEDQEMN